MLRLIRIPMAILLVFGGLIAILYSYKWVYLLTVRGPVEGDYLHFRSEITWAGMVGVAGVGALIGAGYLLFSFIQSKRLGIPRRIREALERKTVILRKFSPPSKSGLEHLRKLTNGRLPSDYWEFMNWSDGLALGQPYRIRDHKDVELIRIDGHDVLLFGHHVDGLEYGLMIDQIDRDRCPVVYLPPERDHLIPVEDSFLAWLARK